MKMQELSLAEIEEVSGAVTSGQVLNYGAAVTAVGGAILGGVGLAAASPVLIGAGVAYGIVSGGMWLGSAMYDMGFFG